MDPGDVRSPQSLMNEKNNESAARDYNGTNNMPVRLKT
jgi:hypothetical protein